MFVILSYSTSNMSMLRIRLVDLGWKDSSVLSLSAVRVHDSAPHRAVFSELGYDVFRHTYVREFSDLCPCLIDSSNSVVVVFQVLGDQ